MALLGAGIAGVVAEGVPSRCATRRSASSGAASSPGRSARKKLDDVLANASVDLAKRGDDFVTMLNQGANADITRAMQDIGLAMAEEFREEGVKIVHNRGWKDWRELKADQDEEERGG
jgi:hypothetical protein